MKIKWIEVMIIVLALGLLSLCFATFDNTIPKDNDPISTWPTSIRANNNALEAILGVDLIGGGGGFPYYQSTAPTYKPDGSTAIDSNDNGRLWIDSDDGTLYHYVDGTGNEWMPFDNVFNVQNFGAKGDGTTDDKTAIQAAFDALSNGDIIYFPNTGNDYVVKSALTCSANSIRIIGSTKGAGSRIDFQSMSGVNGLTLTGYGYYIENIYFFSSDSSTNDGLVLNRSGSATNDNTLIHCTFGAHGGDGLYIERPVTTTLIGCKAINNGDNGFHFAVGGTSVTLIGCWAFSNTGIGCFVNSMAGFSWIGGANTGNGDYAFYLDYSSGAIISGVDGESANNGFVRIATNCRANKISDCLVTSVATGKIGFHFGPSTQTVVDNIVFASIIGDHFHLPGVTNCHIGKVIDIDDGDASGITFSTRSGSCTRSPGQLLSFDSSDTTPSVCAGPNFDIPNGVTIIQLDDGVPGQEVTLISKAAVIFDTTANARLIGSSVDITTASGDVTKWICEVGGTTSSVWRLLSFTDISADWSSGL